MQIIALSLSWRPLRPLALVGLLVIAGCASTTPRLPPPAADGQVADLARAIRELGEDVDWREADRAARVAFDYSRKLADDYAITDSPLLHNLKVNLGLRDRGLCIHWTRDLLTRLRHERFHTLDLHWAIANAEKLFRLEHSTVVISRRGETLDRGLVLDPWRNAGALHWAPTLADSDYHWRPRDEVLAEKARIRAAAEVGNDRL